jgi:hypothetical protein
MKRIFFLAATVLTALSPALIEKGRRVRADIDDAYLTSKHVDELWEGINTGVAEIRTQPGHLGGSTPFEPPIFDDMHCRAKTQRVKTSAANPDARLARKDRPRTVALDRDGDDGHQG